MAACGGSYRELPVALAAGHWFCAGGIRFRGPAADGGRLPLAESEAPEVSATVVGRIQMGDFSPAALRCRIDTFAGSVPADFDADLRDTVLDAMDQMVMATGIAELQPDGATVRVLHISALESLPTARISPLATLQRQQGVTEVRDIDELRGPGEDTDDFGPFLDAIRSARHGDQ